MRRAASARATLCVCFVETRGEAEKQRSRVGLAHVEGAGGVEGDEEAWEEEHRAAVVAREVAVRGLDPLVEGDAAAEGPLDSLRLRERGWWGER